MPPGDQAFANAEWRDEAADLGFGGEDRGAVQVIVMIVRQDDGFDGRQCVCGDRAAWKRFGPAKGTGEARPENTGSVSQNFPASFINTVEWPSRHRLLSGRSPTRARSIARTTMARFGTESGDFFMKRPERSGSLGESAMKRRLCVLESFSFRKFVERGYPALDSLLRSMKPAVLWWRKIPGGARRLHGVSICELGMARWPAGADACWSEWSGGGRGACSGQAGIVGALSGAYLDMGRMRS